MITLTIPINDLILSATDDTDLRELPEAEAILRISTAYTFLPPPLSVVIEDDTVVISLAADYQPAPKINRLYEHATTAANRGQYARAIQLYSQYIAEIPTAVDARRNLGMAHLELGEVDQAERYILEALKLRPQDPYSLLLIGNIYQKHRQQSDVAERFYQKAVAAAPDDAHILANYAALLATGGEYATARDYFDRAIAADPAYPNAYHGKALTYHREKEPATAVGQTSGAAPETCPNKVALDLLYLAIPIKLTSMERCILQRSLVIHLSVLYR